MKFWKAHGLGNDYLVYEGDGAARPLDAPLVRALCERHTGIGGDGILEPTSPAAQADYGVRIWNPDGSVAEKSGNGLRIFAWWLRSERCASSEFVVWTGSCRARCVVEQEGVRVEMGAATFAPAEIPVRAEVELIEEPIAVADTVLPVTAVGMGNPHCVIFTESELDALPWQRWGAELERHSRFPNRTNVQFARARSRSEVEIRIWERGAGETRASGSSSCAVAAAGVRTRRLDPGRIRVLMPGGVLFVTVGPEGVLLEGPVGVVGRFEVSESFRYGSEP